VSFRPTVDQEGGKDSSLKTTVGDSSYHPTVKQTANNTSEIEANIGEDGIKPDISIMKNEKIDDKDIGGDIKINIGNHCINPKLNIVKNLQIFKTFEFLALKAAIPLYCSNCKERLSDQLNKDNVSEINTSGTTTFICKYCGTSTKYEDAVETAKLMHDSNARKFGQIESTIEKLQEKTTQIHDPELRNYIFQRDIIDYMADKFLKICHFVNVVVSDPFEIQEITTRYNNEIEYGLTLDEYLQIIYTYCELPDHPYIKSLAIGDNIKYDSEKQSKKLRSMAYLLNGLINIRDACEKIKQGREFPETTNLLESGEIYFTGAAKLCNDIGSRFSDEKFFKNFGQLCQASANYMKAIRLFSCGYFLPNLFEETTSIFSQIASPGSMELDSTQTSSIFIDPGQTIIREEAEKILEGGADNNALRSESYRNKIQAIPGEVKEIANSYKHNIEKYIPLKNTITNIKITQIAIGLFWILILLGFWNSPSLFMSNILFTLILIIGLPLTILGIGSMKQERHRSLEHIEENFKNIRNNKSVELRRNIALLSYNSSKLVYYLTLPMLKHEDFWDKEIEKIGEWVFNEKKEELLRDVHKIPVEPGKLSNAPPEDLFKETKYREEHHYNRFLQESIGSINVKIPNYLTSSELHNYQSSQEKE